MVFKKFLPIESYPGESKLFLNNQVNKILLDQTFFLNFEGLVRSPWSILYNKSEYNRQFLQVLSSILSSVLHRHKSHATYVRMLLLKRTSLYETIFKKHKEYELKNDPDIAVSGRSPRVQAKL